ncbi:pectin acetylesterase 11-like [Branchiostoma floridae]|uniref:Pectin acetylesterase 11-like n=1 Tax=Branchiostoma floridae TaxID=7739 RepID=A0A9J7N0A7_BRAFL|nr:pectin acetylesterase 11-like [Branchiostoma floridae]
MQTDCMGTPENVATDMMHTLKTKRKLLKIFLVTILVLGAAQVAFRCQKTPNQDWEEETASRLDVLWKRLPFDNTGNQSLVINASTNSQQPTRRPKMKLRLLPKNTANRTGAFCLDGSVPGYYFEPGVGDAVRSWVIYLPGGEACFTLDNCRKRAVQTKGLGAGTTRKMANTTNGHGLRSTNKTINPDFWDWNMVEVVYCDGFFFSGDRADVVVHDGRELYFRGKRILQAVVDDLLSRGLAQATDVIFHGFSAGAAAVLRHASWVRHKLPETVNFKIFVASAALPMLPNVRTGTYFKETTLVPAIRMHHAARSAPEACLREADPSGLTMKCHEPFNLLRYQEADLFVAGYVYDAWLLDNILEARCTPKTCKGASEQVGLKNVSLEISETLPSLLKPQDGLYMVNCKKHFIITDHNTWSAGVLLGGMTAAKAFTDWFHGRGNNHKHMDCVTFQCYPNPTCRKAKL